jgi:hypothetical protein
LTFGVGLLQALLNVGSNKCRVLVSFTSDDFVKFRSSSADRWYKELVTRHVEGPVARAVRRVEEITVESWESD